jgi:hypothetical protein
MEKRGVVPAIRGAIEQAILCRMGGKVDLGTEGLVAEPGPASCFG